MRAAQDDTLNFFNSLGEKGATIGDVADTFGIRTSSARSRVIRCLDHEWLKERKEKGPTGPQRRFFVTAKGKKALAEK